MLDLIKSIASTDVGAWVAALTALVTAANAITVLTPTKSDNDILKPVLRILNILSVNFGKNRNADD